jgi:uncharacterized protein GlcG (DUF336 family)
MAARRLSSALAAAIIALVGVLALAEAGFAQGAAPALPDQLISTAEARAIIEGAFAFARGKNLRLGAVVTDAAGEMIAGERMDGAPGRNLLMATAKAFTSVTYRTASGKMAELYKTSPDRYFGIMNLYGSKVYLVGGGVPLEVNGKLVGGVGVAGLPDGMDEAAARAGIAAWEKVRASLRK